MEKGFEQIKILVKTASDKTLKEMYSTMNISENSDVAEMAVYTALTNEMEERNLIFFNDETFEYELVK